MTDAAIRAENLSKRFWLHPERRTGLKERFIRGRAPAAREFWALREASFEIKRGSVFGLMGQNGSGKSTTLKVLAGIYRPTSGTVEVNGRVSALLELGAGFHPELTGRENIRLNGSILGLSNREIESKMDRIVDFAGIGEFIDAPVKVYSSGMYVRLGFAVAVSLDPEILMVDEIIAVGDEEFQRKCFDYLFDLRRRGSTIVIVSHSLGILRDLCDQAVWLDHGRIRSIGDASTVVEDYLREVNDREQHALQAGPVAEPTPEPTPVQGSEPAPAPEPGMPPEPPRLHRQGSGEVRIERIEYLDDKGLTTPVLVSGAGCTFRFHYRASVVVDDVAFGVGFFGVPSVDVAGVNSRSSGGWHIEPGSGYVDLCLSELILNPSNYRVSASVVKRAHVIDLADREYELRVRGRGDEEWGMVRMTGQWGKPVPTGAEAVVASEDPRVAE